MFAGGVEVDNEFVVVRCYCGIVSVCGYETVQCVVVVVVGVVC